MQAEQDVILNFPPRAEADDECQLADVFARQRALDDGYEGMAMSLYRLRAIWIGGMCLPWGLLTQGQRDGYINEVKTLVKKAKGED
jgi:hypothetical protein